MAKLLRIILIDSLCPGDLVEVKVDDNTCLTGTNGIGKSTFLKLIPLFFGAPAGRMVKKGVNTFNFADHYLPNGSSYIVFEYENHDGALRVAILHRSSFGHAYQLIGSGWRPELLYVDQESGELVPTGQVQKHVAALGVDCTPELQPLHYRMIIQYNTGAGDLDGVEDVSRKKMITLYRRSYSLAPARHHFAGIDSLMFSLLESKGTFDSMEAAVGEILKQEAMRSDVDLSGIEAHAFASAIASRASFLVMDNETRPRVLRLSEVRSRLLGNEMQQGRLKSVAMAIQRSVEQERGVLADAMAQLLSQETDAQDRAQKSLVEIQERLGLAKASSAQLLQMVRQIEVQRELHESAGMPALLADLGRLPSLHEDVAAKREQLQLVTSQGADIQARFTEMVRAVRDTLAERRDRRRAEAQAKASEIQRLLDAHAQQAEDAIRRATKAHQDEREVHESELKELLASWARAAGEAEFLGKQKLLPETVELIDAEQSAIADLHDAQESLRAALGQHDEQAAVLAAEQQRHAQEMASVAARGETLAEEVSRLIGRLNAADGSLLSFLRTGFPGWESTVGRVIDPRLLDRTDLAPAIDDGGGSSLFGLQVDLGRLEPVDSLDLSALESTLAATNLQLEEIEEMKQSLARSAAALQVRRKAHAEARTGLLSEHAKLAEDVSARKQRLETLRDEGAQRIDQLKAKAIAGAKKAEQLLREREHLIGELKAGFGRHTIELQAIAGQARQELEAQRREVDDSLSQALAMLDSQASADLSQIEADRLAALHGAGVDPGTVRRLEADVAKLDAAIKRLNEKLPEIQNYKAWLESELPQLPEREARYAEADQAVQRVDRELRAWREESEARVKTHKLRQAEHSARLAVLLEQTSVLRSTLDRLGAVDPIDVGLESLEMLSPADIEAEAARLSRDAQQLKQEGRALFREIEAPYLGQHRGTPEADVVQDIAMRSRNADASGDRFWVLASPDLQMYIDDGHDLQRSKLITRVRTLCTQVVENRKVLMGIHKAIQDVGRRATIKVAEVLGRFPEFTDFNLNVTSKIQEMTIWDDISALDAQFARWNTMATGTLPPDGLDHALRMMLRRIGEGWVSSRLEDCFSTSLTWMVNGRPRVARNTAELGDGLSTGQLKIVVGMIYLALFEMIRREADFELLVPVDEALELEVNNAATLLANFNSRNVNLLLGFPGGAPELMRNFKNLYALDRRKSGAVYLKEYRGMDAGGVGDLNDGLPQLEGEEVQA